MNKYKLLLLLTWVLVVNANGQTQLKKWYMASQEIDMQSTTLPSITPSGGSSIGPSNGIYDINGNLQFYISAGGVYDKKGTGIGSLYGNTYRMNDAVIVPYINNDKCNNKYYVFYLN
jgi:hypothetical protein